MERLYVISDETLDIGLRAVQAGHAAVKFATTHPDKEWEDSYLIFLQGDVNLAKTLLEERNIDFVAFYEPDLGNVLTAVSFLDNKKLFKEFKLLSK